MSITAEPTGAIGPRHEARNGDEARGEGAKDTPPPAPRRHGRRLAALALALVATAAAVVAGGAGLPGMARTAGASPARVTAALAAAALPEARPGAATPPGGITVGPSGASSLPGPGASAAGGASTPGGPGSGTSPSPGLFDITGHIEAAIDSWFQSLVTSALDPVLALLGQTLLATPNVTGNAQVASLWSTTRQIADALLVLFVLVGGAIVMSHETLQSRTALKDVLPHLVAGALLANASLSLAGLALHLADALSQAILGSGVGPANVVSLLDSLVIGSLAGGGIFFILLGGVIAVLALVLLGTYVVRLALVVLLVVAAPLALICHCLPQTQSFATMWWRAFGGCLLVQLAQSLVLISAVKVFLGAGGTRSLGLSVTGGLIDLLVSGALCWVLVRIPTWVGRAVFGRGHGGMVRVVRDTLVYKGLRAAAGGPASLAGSLGRPGSRSAP